MNAGSSTHDDLRYARELAEQGARAPLIGGRFMVWWGALVTIAYVAQHFALTGRFGTDGGVFAMIWLSFGVVATCGHFALQRGMRAKAGAGSAGNIASRTVWIAAALTLAAMAAGLVVAVGNGAPPTVFDWIVPTGFAVYACALIVTGGLAGDRTVRAAGLGAVAMVGLSTALHAWPDRYLVSAAGVALTVLLPGLLLVRAEPRA